MTWEWEDSRVARVLWDWRCGLHRLVRGMVLCDVCNGTGNTGCNAAVCCDECGGCGEISRQHRRIVDEHARKIIARRELSSDSLRLLTKLRGTNRASARVARQVLRRRLIGRA